MRDRKGTFEMSNGRTLLMLGPDTNGWNLGARAKLAHVLPLCPPDIAAIKINAPTIVHAAWSGIYTLIIELGLQNHCLFFDLKLATEVRTIQSIFKDMRSANILNRPGVTYVNVWASKLGMSKLPELVKEFPQVRILVLVADSFTNTWDIPFPPDDFLEWCDQLHSEGGAGIIIPASLGMNLLDITVQGEKRRNTCVSIAQQAGLEVHFTGIRFRGSPHTYVHADPIDPKAAAYFCPTSVVIGSDIFDPSSGSPIDAVRCALHEIETGNRERARDRNNRAVQNAA